MATMTIRIEDTKSSEPLEPPTIRQSAATLNRRFAGKEQFAGDALARALPSETSAFHRLQSN